MSMEASEEKLQSILKLSLQQCISLARKKIRSKKGINDLQSLLIDYRQQRQLAKIILEVIKLIALYENNKKEQSDEIKDTVTLDEYNHLEAVLQKYESSIREQIRNQQQLKIYCEQLQAKNREIQKENDDLLKSTKQIITNLKRQSHRLIQQNHKLRDLVSDQRQTFKRQSRQKDDTFINSIKKSKMFVDSSNNKNIKQQSSIPQIGERSDDSIKNRRNSMHLLKAAK